MQTNAATALHDLTATADAVAAVLPVLDALEPNERVTLELSPSGATSTLEALQSSRKGLFEWSVLGGGSPLRIELRRRNVPQGELRGVTEALGWDHDRLEEIEAAAFAARDAAEYSRAGELWREFETGLRRHIGFEEQLLFPVFEQRLGFPPQAGPTAVMRHEHRLIEALLAQIASEIGVAGSAAERTRERLHHVLGEHNVKEEQILYPQTDGALDPREADALVASIQRY
jgi:hemerythrin-like domain-containing protein